MNTVGNLIMLIRMNRLEKNKTGRTVTAKCVDIKTRGMVLWKKMETWGCYVRSD
ncbi:MAG: hypothetical protein PUB10_07495 [Clostridiales bacterium]|nr:hypothetical protein [Clostridiales bacterium]